MYHLASLVGLCSTHTQWVDVTLSRCFHEVGTVDMVGLYGLFRLVGRLRSCGTVPIVVHSCARAIMFLIEACGVPKLSGAVRSPQGSCLGPKFYDAQTSVVIFVLPALQFPPNA